MMDRAAGRVDRVGRVNHSTPPRKFMIEVSKPRFFKEPNWLLPFHPCYQGNEERKESKIDNIFFMAVEILQK